MADFLNDAGMVDQSAIEHAEPQYIKGQWANGDPKMKAAGGVAYTGGLLIDRDKYLPHFVKAATGWVDAPYTFENGKTINAVLSAAPKLAVVRMRFRWFTVRGSETTYYPRRAYDAKLNMRGQLQALCGVAGYDFPVVFTFKGMASKHFDTALRDFTAKIGAAVALAAREKNAPTATKYPRYAFWLSLAPGKHEKVGEKGAESTITPPTLILPEKVDSKHLNSAYVGRDLLQAFQAHFHEAESWAGQWDKAGEQSAELADEPAPEADGEPSMTNAPRADAKADEQMTFGAGEPKKRPSNYDPKL